MGINSSRSSRKGVTAPDQLLALFAANNLDELVEAAFRVLQDTVACDFASAFYRSSAKGLLKERDSRGRESSPEFMRRHLELNPAIPLAMANRGIRLLPTRTGLPGSEDELRRTPFYREIMRPQGWRHAVALCFWESPPGELPVFVASVNRREGRNDFSKSEIRRLESVHPFLECAVRRVHEREAAQSVRDGMAMTVRDETRGLAILDWNLRLVEANPIARRLCAAWGDDAGGTRDGASGRTWRLPSVLIDACCELKHEWESLLHANPSVVVRRHAGISHPHVPGLTASITLVCRDVSGLSDPSFVLELDGRIPGSATDAVDRSLPVLQKMTGAERAVAMVLVDGLSNQEIADRLAKSVHAVKFLLHRIYQKTGVRNRAALVAALGARH
jgi:DNA-binding CsgD family transcriptional regulator